MALSQADRISISKKIVEIPLQDKLADENKAVLESEKAVAQAEDDTNKSLMADPTAAINEYQKELAILEGNVRTELTEADIQKSANKEANSDFFPNVIETPITSVPTGIWINFIPFSNSLGVGKTYEETFPSTQAIEGDSTTAMLALISTLESENTTTELATGQECLPADPDNGTCSPASEITDEATCILDPLNTWTPDPIPETIQNKQKIHDDLTLLLIEVNGWMTKMQLEKTSLEAANLVDTNSGRVTKNNTAIASLTAAIDEANAWIASTDFYTAHGATTCAQFDALDPSTFPPTKLAVDELTALKAQISSRDAAIPSRIVDLLSDEYLGSVSQDYATGSILDALGLYGKRFRIIDMRLNLMAGSLSKLKGLEQGQGAQDQSKESNANANAALTSLMSASGFRAPASNTSTIHVLDGSLFSGGDLAYVAANTQEEITVNIVSVQNNTIFLDKPIPKKYRQDDFARLYKEI